MQAGQFHSPKTRGARAAGLYLMCIKSSLLVKFGPRFPRMYLFFSQKNPIIFKYQTYVETDGRHPAVEAISVAGLAFTTFTFTARCWKKKRLDFRDFFLKNGVYIIGEFSFLWIVCVFFMRAGSCLNILFLDTTVKGILTESSGLEIWITLPETDIACESLGLEDEFQFGKASWQVRTVSFGECKYTECKYTVHSSLLEL